ncbi:helix-turn-helix domain-containing protein [Lentzea sp. NPDC042327]|uniref:helix-turn-helix domain-containing protein n=1 Tax=Lentzea sp. NPDC042327 TaxID=3154801 RepID=UPI0033F5EAE6
MTANGKATPPVNGPRRAADVLKVFSTDPGPKRVTDLSLATGLSPATASRIASGLVDSSLLARKPDKSFVPGPGLIELARAVLTDIDIVG